MKTIGIVMGSKSDLPVAQKAIDTLELTGDEKVGAEALPLSLPLRGWRPIWPARLLPIPPCP